MWTSQVVEILRLIKVIEVKIEWGPTQTGEGHKVEFSLVPILVLQRSSMPWSPKVNPLEEEGQYVTKPKPKR